MKLVNLDNIKYIFQIPLEWFQRVHNACFNSYGEDFIVVTNEDDGTNKIGINEEDFALKVEQYASGKVKTVDGHEPDEDGNVSFELAASKPVVTDANGHLTTTNDSYATVDYVDTEVAAAIEQAEDAMTAAENAQTAAENAQTAANAAQSTADNAYNGAVQAIADASRAHQLANEVDIKLVGVENKADAAKAAADAAQAAADAAQTTAEDAAQLAAEAYEAALDAEELADAADTKADAAGTKADAADTKADEAKQLAQSAYSPTNKPSHSDISDWGTATDDFVTTTAEPTQARYVTLVGTQLTPVQPSPRGITLLSYNRDGTPAQTLLGTQRGILINDGDSLACQTTLPNSFIATNANNEVGSLNSTTGGYPMFNENGVPTVQKFTPNKLVAVGSNGLLGTMDSLPTGFVYSTNGSISTKAFGTTAGTVAEGNHTHDDYATYEELEAVDEKADLAYDTATDANTAATQALTTANTANETANDAMDVAEGAVSIAQLCYSPTNPPYTSDIADWSDATGKFVTIDTAQTISGSKTFSNTVIIQNPNIKYFNIKNTTSGNESWLEAGRLYLNSSYSSDVVFRNNSSTIQADIKCINGQGLILDGTAANKVALQYQPTDETTDSKAVATVGYCQSKFSKIKSVDGHTPGTDGAVSFGLTASKWVKTDANGHLTTTNDTPITASTTSTGYVYNTNGTISYKSPLAGTQTVTVVTGLSWTGTNLVAARSTLTFTDGLLTAVASATSNTIGTVTYNP